MIKTKEDLEELLYFFKSKNIVVKEKTHFIPHLQNQVWFVIEEGKWSNNFIK